MLVRFSQYIGRFSSSRHSGLDSSRHARAALRSAIAEYGRHRSFSVKAICSRASNSRAIARDASPASTASCGSPPLKTFSVIRFHSALDSAARSFTSRASAIVRSHSARPATASNTGVGVAYRVVSARSAARAAALAPLRLRRRLHLLVVGNSLLEPSGELERAAPDGIEMVQRLLCAAQPCGRFDRPGGVDHRLRVRVQPDVGVGGERGVPKRSHVIAALAGSGVPTAAPTPRSGSRTAPRTPRRRAGAAPPGAAAGSCRTSRPG